MNSKLCTKCHKEKSLDEFNNRKDTKDKLTCWCKKCKKEYDRNHKTDKVRGLLCDNCNNGLGRFQDNVNILTKAIKYLGV